MNTETITTEVEIPTERYDRLRQKANKGHRVLTLGITMFIIATLGLVVAVLLPHFIAGAVSDPYDHSLNNPPANTYTNVP